VSIWSSFCTFGLDDEEKGSPYLDVLVPSIDAYIYDTAPSEHWQELPRGGFFDVAGSVVPLLRFTMGDEGPVLLDPAQVRMLRDALDWWLSAHHSMRGWRALFAHGARIAPGRQGWSVHACWRDEVCRTYGAPKRLHLGTPLGMLILAMNWEARTQLWVPFFGWTTIWSPIVWDPHKRVTRHKHPRLLRRWCARCRWSK
jgi:hypothetical protein